MINTDKLHQINQDTAKDLSLSSHICIAQLPIDFNLSNHFALDILLKKSLFVIFSSFCFNIASLTLGFFINCLILSGFKFFQFKETLPHVSIWILQSIGCQRLLNRLNSSAFSTLIICL
jgi:hypothetical protein